MSDSSELFSPSDYFPPLSSYVSPSLFKIPSKNIRIYNILKLLTFNKKLLFGSTQAYAAEEIISFSLSLSVHAVLASSSFTIRDSFL